MVEKRQKDSVESAMKYLLNRVEVLGHEGGTEGAEISVFSNGF